MGAQAGNLGVRPGPQPPYRPLHDPVHSSPWERVRQLPLRVEAYELEGLELVTNSSYRRLTTIVHLAGQGQEGLGEELNWDPGLQEKFRNRGGHLPLAGEYTLASFSAHLGDLELSPDPPPIDSWRDFRRWGFESAALDLALRQNRLGIEGAFGIDARPLRFAVSLGLHGFDALQERLAIHADMRFKLDATPDWSVQLCEDLAATGAVDVIDFKGAYIGTPVDVEADLALYQRVLAAMPEVVVEDPHTNPEVLAFLRESAARVAWDAPIHSIADMAAMPIPPSALNIKPSRFGTLKGLLEAYEECYRRGLPMYGGGQFELGPGREQIQILASLFHPDASNDVAPRGYHQLENEEARPASPLDLPLAAGGFGLG